MKSALHHRVWNTYHFASRCRLAEEDLTQLMELFQSSDRDAGSILGGRRSASRTRLKEIGPVVIKHYRRGGMLASFIRKTYLAFGKRRCQIEFEQMERVRELGVCTPEPIAYVYKGLFFYQAWLITREIENHRSIAELSRTEPPTAESSLAALGEQVTLLIENGILHADFHPGNVLVDRRGTVFIIDFDKSTLYKSDKQSLKKKYWQRWHRSVCKHDLPKMLSEVMRKHLVD